MRQTTRRALRSDEGSGTRSDDVEVLREQLEELSEKARKLTSGSGQDQSAKTR